MNKDKLIKWISTEIEKENQKCDNAQSVKIQDNHLAIIVGIDRVKEYIQSEPEETCTYTHDEDTDTWKCSKCENTWVFMENTSPEENDMFYCPKCGRKLNEKAGE